MFHKYHFPRFCCAVDGMMVNFSEAPRKLPQNKNPQQFLCCKQKYAENVQLVCNHRYIATLVLTDRLLAEDVVGLKISLDRPPTHPLGAPASEERYRMNIS